MRIKRFGRVLVCLLLVAVILVNCSPIKAEATAATLLLSPVAVPCLTAIAAVITGLGVLAIADNPRFQVLVSDCLDSLREKGLLGNSDTIDMYKMVGDDIGQYMISQEIAEAVRDYLWESGTLTEAELPEGYVSHGGYAFPVINTTYPYVFVGLRDDKILLHASNFVPYGSHFTPGGSSVPYEFYTIVCKTSSYSGFSVYEIGDSGWEYYYSGSINSSVSSGSWSFDSFIWSNCDICYKSDGSLIFAGSSIDELGSGCIGVADGLAAGTIAGQDKTFAEGYSAWYAGAQILPSLKTDDGKSVPYIPLGMGKTWEETMAMSQADVQSGVGTYEDTISGTASDTVTATGLKGWLDTLRLTLVSGFSDLVDGIVSIPEKILSGISSLFVPSAEAMAEQQDKWTELLSDRFGAVYDSVALIDDIAGAFSVGTTQAQIRFPSITIPFGDVNWEFGGWLVDVVPDGFEVLVDALKLGIDILCTLAFVNAMKFRFNRILEGPA